MRTACSDGFSGSGLQGDGSVVGAWRGGGSTTWVAQDIQDYTGDEKNTTRCLKKMTFFIICIVLNAWASLAMAYVQV